MGLDSGDKIDWLEPWHPVEQGEQALIAELAREVGPQHPLFGQRAVPVARRSDCDDVLFALPGSQTLLALVHLTWSGQRETDPQWPSAKFFSSWDEWIEQGMKPDHRAYQADAGTTIHQ